MARIGGSGEALRCSFCGEHQRHVHKLIAGPGVFICDKCIELCCQIMIEDGTLDPRKRFPDLDLPSFLWAWVDGVDREEPESVGKAKALLEELLAGLDEPAPLLPIKSLSPFNYFNET